MPTMAMQRVKARLRVRGGAPSIMAPKVAVLDVGATIQPEAQVVGDVFAGNAAWFRLSGERYVWAGGCDLAPGPSNGSAASDLDVPRRADGSIAVLSSSEMAETYGRFAWRAGAKRGAIQITDGWADKNLVRIDAPILKETGFSRIWVHRLAAKPFTRVFAAIEQAGLADLIRTCAGTFVPRHMGWNPSRNLSSHSWGVAIDINAEWNGYGSTPAAMGAIGSVREIVGLFEAEGFAWGGYFKPQTLSDGMHFELARRSFA